MNDPARPDVVIIMTDEERAAPAYEPAELAAWRAGTLVAERWFAEHAVNFERHYTGSLACVPSRPTIFTGQYPDCHGVTQTDGLGKRANDSRMRWLRPWEVPTLGNWFRAAGYDTHYDGKWHISHADLTDPATGRPLATNDDEGTPNEAAVAAYLEADPLAAYGFSGWVGPEPHGAPLANSGLRRDPLIAERVVNWLADRYRRRSEGDPEAMRPFLLVASFVNPHDIVLFPLWQRSNPLGPAEHEPPPVPPAPTAGEDLSAKPAAQIAYRTSYPTGYGPAPMIHRLYERNAAEYRRLYYRLHAEVDRHVERVRSAVVEGSAEAVLVRTSDHGDLLGAHGGLHQKWFNLYDEAVRVPLSIARLGAAPSAAATVAEPTSHVDLVPTLLSAAGIDTASVAAELAGAFSEVHSLPGRDLTGVLEGVPADPDRAAYIITRDNIMEGDTSASGVARRFGRSARPPMPLRIEVPAHVGSNFEGVVARVPEERATGGAGHLWKIVRTFDDPATWTVPGVSHLASDAAGTEVHRSSPVADEWELYDLTADPAETQNRCDDPPAAAVFDHMVSRLAEERSASERPRNNPWPYAMRRPRAPHPEVAAPPPARLARRLLQRAGLHPDWQPAGFDLRGARALIVCTNHSVLGVGRPTGVFASEMTVPYYAFADAGMIVDLASPAGGDIPVDPLSLRGALRSAADDRMLADPVLRGALGASQRVADIDATGYDIVFLAGGWGAAFDLGRSEALGEALSAAHEAGSVLGGVCHGPLGFCRAVGSDGGPLVAGRRVSAVTDKQVRELRIDTAPMHPETELRRLGALFDCRHARRDVLANHWVTDGRLVTGQNQNAGPMVADEMMRLVAT